MFVENIKYEINMKCLIILFSKTPVFFGADVLNDPKYFNSFNMWIYLILI